MKNINIFATIHWELFMKVYAISDLHLSINSNKPMNIFGPVWDGYLEKIEESCNNKSKNLI